MSTQYEVLAKLPPASWNGIPFPIVGRKVDHAFEAAERGLQYRNGKLVDATGGQNWSFAYSVPLRQGVASKWKDLFTVTLPKLLAAYRDVQESELVDPVYGTFWCRPVSWSESLTVARRDGVDLEIVFAEKPLLVDFDADVQEFPSVNGVASSAAELDAAIEAVEWEQEIPAPATTDALRAIDGLGAQLQMQGDRIAAAMGGVARRCDAIIDRSEELEDPVQRVRMIRAARALRLSSQRAAEKAAYPQRTIRRVVNGQVRSVAAVAAEFGMTLEGLLALNPGLAARPMVPAGIEVFCDQP
jgi:hypothetical protein